jgi:hypothetical protein
MRLVPHVGIERPSANFSRSKSIEAPAAVLDGLQIYRDAQKPDRYLDLLARAARSRDERLALVPEGSWRDRYRALPFNGEIQSALEAL